MLYLDLSSFDPPFLPLPLLLIFPWLFPPLSSLPFSTGEDYFLTAQMLLLHILGWDSSCPHPQDEHLQARRFSWFRSKIIASSWSNWIFKKSIQPIFNLQVTSFIFKAIPIRADGKVKSDICPQHLTCGQNSAVSPFCGCTQVSSSRSQLPAVCSDLWLYEVA